MSEALLVVQIGPYALGAPVAAVTEIVPLAQVTRIPGTPAAVAGLAVLRGQPLVVLSLRPALGLEPTAPSLALCWAGQPEAVLVAVDAVDSLWTPPAPLPAGSWEDLVPPAFQPHLVAGYARDEQWVFALTPRFPFDWLAAESAMRAEEPA